MPKLDLYKFKFYARGMLEHVFIPNVFYTRQLKRLLSNLANQDKDMILNRVNYYNKMDQVVDLPEAAQCLSDLLVSHKTCYYYDYRSILRYFPEDKRIALRFGDITDVASFPRIVKTRPLNTANQNSILLKLNSVRHFKKIHDSCQFRDKKNLIVWRGKARREHRKAVLRKLFDHPLCDFGKTDQPVNDPNSHWNKAPMPVSEQLGYKFILSVEGNEVATNLKWIAQSNSLCFMTKPKFESWFMEGRLEPGKHYVELKDDYSDLPEKVEYYIANPDEAEQIISTFKSYYQSFENKEVELLISLLVVNKYLSNTSQLKTDFSP